MVASDGELVGEQGELVTPLPHRRHDLHKVLVHGAAWTKHASIIQRECVIIHLTSSKRSQMFLAYCIAEARVPSNAFY